MSIVIKSNSVFTGQDLVAGVSDYMSRVESDGGEIVSKDSVIYALLFASRKKITSTNCLSATSASWGVKKSGSDITKLYSLFGSAGDVILTGAFPHIQTSDGWAVAYSGASASLAKASFAAKTGNFGAIIKYSEPALSIATRRIYTLQSGSTAVLRTNLSDSVSASYYQSIESINTINRSSAVRNTGAILNLDRFTVIDSIDGESVVVGTSQLASVDSFILGGQFPNTGSAFVGNIYEAWATVNMDLDTFRVIGNR